MSQEQAAHEMTVLRTESHVLWEVYQVGGLAAAIERLIMMRNQRNGLSETVIQARIAVLQPAIMLLKAQLKKEVRDRLVPALEAWEKLDE
jgi:hypothetical protein